ncbi:hypothetical protein SBA2_260086 [Acidobacteriia bacterium SbA2]|nr:hypothetical protein SBA2_260086 [Acidobacteriia bacterium SbA2]
MLANRILTDCGIGARPDFTDSFRRLAGYYLFDKGGKFIPTFKFIHGAKSNDHLRQEMVCNSRSSAGRDWPSSS